MTNDKPHHAIAGLSELLQALGDELRTANQQVGERRLYDMEGKDRFEPVLFFDHAEVELNLTATKSAEGGVKVWVLSGKGVRSSERTIRLKIDLNGPHGGQYGVGA
jgi:hypothetical protein